MSLSSLAALLLLSGLVAGAAAELDGRCDVPHLAAGIAQACAPGEGTLGAPCCELVVAAVHVGGGGSCIFAIASEAHVLRAGMSASTLASKYHACGGTRVINNNHGPRSLLQALPPATAVVVQEEKKTEAATQYCNAHLLGSTIVDTCVNKSSPSDHCCIAVVAAVDMRGCLCKVAVDSSIIDAGEDLTAHDIMKIYQVCGDMEEPAKDYSVDRETTTMSTSVYVAKRSCSSSCSADCSPSCSRCSPTCSRLHQGLNLCRTRR